MSVAPLPKVIEPLKLIEQRVDLEGTVALSQCGLLSDVLLDRSGDIHIFLSFKRDEEGLNVITGSLRADVRMECQRCLQPMDFKVQGQINLAIARHENAVRALPGYYDPLLLEDPELALWPLIEQELLLNLPIVAKHPEGECELHSSYRVEDEDFNKDKPNPFAVLAQLKNRK